jgi:hypothetical protein
MATYDIAVVNEYGLELGSFVVFDWEPVILLQIKLGMQLRYPVKLYSNEQEKLPCDTWNCQDVRVVAFEDIRRSCMWDKVTKLQINDDVIQRFDVTLVNSMRIEIDFGNMCDTIGFRVNGVHSDGDDAWYLNIPASRSDIMESLIADSEKLYIDIVLRNGADNDDIVDCIEHVILEENLASVFHVVFHIHNAEGDKIYCKII